MQAHPIYRFLPVRVPVVCVYIELEDWRPVPTQPLLIALFHS